VNPYNDMFDDNGMLEIPTMRGSANLDAEDYGGFSETSSILDDDLDDDLDEDILSHPGRGAGPATDIDGTDSFDMLDGDMDAPGMEQTTYGNSPWGPGSGSGYRPHSQQSTDMSLRALGDDERAPSRQEEPMEDDSMMYEPEIIEAIGARSPTPWGLENHGNQNSMPSNAHIDPQTIYDRSSYEHTDSDQNIIGNGIFDMEEGVTWRPRDGMFADQYAMPAYLAQEDELGVQQSKMWDSTAGEWRVTQPSASGVALSRRVQSMKAPYSTMANVQTRPEVTGPRSHIEAFGRKAAACLIEETRHHHSNRSQFLASAISTLGPQAAEKARSAAAQLVKFGYRPDVALEDALAHSIMHAAMRDLSEGKGTTLLRLDRMASKVTQTKGALQSAAATHLAPLASNRTTLKRDLGAFHASPAFQAMGAVDASSADTVPAPAPSASSGGIFTAKNVLIAGGIGVGAWMIWGNRKKITKNLKKLAKLTK